MLDVPSQLPPFHTRILPHFTSPLRLDNVLIVSDSINNLAFKLLRVKDLINSLSVTEHDLLSDSIANLQHHIGLSTSLNLSIALDARSLTLEPCARRAIGAEGEAHCASAGVVVGDGVAGAPGARVGDGAAGIVSEMINMGRWW